MALALDGSTSIVQPGTGTTNYNIGPLTTTFAKGEVFIVHNTNGGGFISSISGGGLTFVRRAFTSLGGNNQIFEEWAAPVGNSVVNNVTFAITIPGGASGITTCLFAVSNGGNTVAFDAGGPQTSTVAAATMTTSETAFIICSGRISGSDHPTASAPWSGIMSNVANTFEGIEYQVAAAGTYTGAFSNTPDFGSIIDALYDNTVQVTLMGQGCW